jgi:hypothetical protein
MELILINTEKRREDRMRRLKSAFSRWALPARLLGGIIILCGFTLILVAQSTMGIVVTVLGSLVWQIGTVLEHRSPLLRRLKTSSVRPLMRTEQISVPNW